NGMVYVGSLGSRGYPYKVGALNASTGVLLWSYGTGGWAATPAVANGVVYVGSFDKNLYALNAGTGALLWNYTTGSYIQDSPAVANGVVYIGSYDGTIYAFGLGGDM